MLFSQIPSHDALKESFIRNINAGRVSHGQLFVGLNGYGGLALALAYLQYLYCTDRQETDSCGNCSNCRRINILEHPDVHFSFPIIKQGSAPETSSDYIKVFREAVKENPFLENEDWLLHLKGGKTDNKQGNISAHEARHIIKRLSLTTLEGGFKTMIIFLPEYLEKEGNILLKIMEEPPEKTLFILIAEQESEIISTILSRMQIVRIPPIPQTDIHKYLRSKFELDEDKSSAIAFLAEGNLNKAVHLANGEEDNQFTVFFIDWMRACYKNNIAKYFALSDEASKWSREEAKNYCMYCLRMVRESFLLTMNASQLTHLLPAEHEFLSKFHPFINDKNIQSLQDELTSAHYHIERNANIKILFFNLSMKVHGMLSRK